jgi:hypothetical protein
VDKDLERIAEAHEKLHAGLALLGNMVRSPLWEQGASVRCTTLHSNGMVECEGCDMHGPFDPKDLEIVGERVAVPVLGKVD